jgi:DNA polymerase I-like protein with 3'-5' exonuclease and polymerase domains
MNLEELKNKFPQGVWLLDTEYATPANGFVIPVCVVGKEYFSGQCIRQFFDDTSKKYGNPFPVDDKALFVAYAAHAEWGCFLSLGWQPPKYILDLYAEFRNEISGLAPPFMQREFDTRLLGAMQYYKLDMIAAAEKKEMQERIGRGFPFTADEHAAILEYCESDVNCLEKLLPVMASDIELVYALFRGRYSKAVARIERAGMPVDRPTYERLVRNREALKSRLIDDFEAKYGPSPYFRDRHGINKFSFKKLSLYLDSLGLLDTWQLTPTQQLTTKEDYLQQMARTYPALQPLADLVKRIGDFRKFGLIIGSDDRTRYPVMPFQAISGRNQPKARQFVFAQSSWTRGLIKPGPDEFLAYIDWSAAEFCIAGALSKDLAMIEAYQSGDPYIRSAINMGLAPKGATKESHGLIRDTVKIWLLSAQYGATARSLVEALPYSLAQKVPNPLALAEEFLEKHRRIYRRYWEWAENRVQLFQLETHCEETVFGWRHHFDSRLKNWQARTRSLNFPMQGNCSEALRWACVYATEAGIEISATLHDALLVCGRVNEAEEIVRRARVCMDQASQLVLGCVMHTDVKITKYPDRFMDPRGADTWKTIMQLVDGIEKEKGHEVHA